jgi:uncharacterized membrane protein (UPF0127 family)
MLQPIIRSCCLHHDIMHSPRRLVLALLLAVAGSAVADEAPQMNLPVVQLQAGMHNIRAQVALTPDQRATGLMHRREMPQHEGMLFVFEQPSLQCFWMKNTLLPLSIAFLADDGTVVNIDEMKPQTLDSHCSDKPVRFVLEMNQGWFAKRGVKPGFKLTGQPFAAR